MEYKKGYKRTCISVCAIAVIFLLGRALPLNAAGSGVLGEKGKPSVEQGSFFMDEPERKDPFIAGVLSWAWPGLGQFYTQNYKSGSIFLLADLVQKGLLVYGAFYYSDKYSPSGGNVVRWSDMRGRDQGIIIGYVFSVLFLKTYCVVDAAYSAEHYNREIYYPYWKSKNKAWFSFDAGKDGVNLSVTRHLQF